MLVGLDSETFPPFLRKLKKIKYLNLRYCNIYKIPDWIVELDDLRVLDLLGNDIMTIPDMSKMSKLREVCLSSGLQMGGGMIYNGDLHAQPYDVFPENCRISFLDDIPPE